MVFRVNEAGSDGTLWYGSERSCMVFFQGCLHNCSDCPYPSYKPLYGGFKADTEHFKKAIVANPDICILQLGGGEPFVQVVAALDLAKFAKSHGLRVECRTGYKIEDILEWEDNREELLKNIDVLVDGPCTKQRVVDVKKSLEKGEVVLYESK